DDSGAVGENQWAFYPLHPAVVSTLSELTGVSYEIISPIVSTLAAALASIVILNLFRKYLDADQALFGLALVLFFRPAGEYSHGHDELQTVLPNELQLILVVEHSCVCA